MPFLRICDILFLTVIFRCWEVFFVKKHIVCLGDSNTHGYCADPADCADGGNRFNENERWPRVLEELLGEEYLVLEEGLSGRTTVFADPLHESMDALSVAYPILMSHEPVNLLVIMLGTNDTKDRLGMNAACIGLGMERLVRKCMSVDCWGKNGPNVLIVAPPPIGDELNDPCMGTSCAEKSRGIAKYYKEKADLLGCHFMDANGCEFNSIDYMHLTRKGHTQLAERVAQLVPRIMK